MKVHFMAPIVGGNRDDYAKIISTIEKLGHSLVSKHVIERSEKEIVSETPEEAELYTKKLSSWFKKADVIVFETTRPDVSIGFEVATALNHNKPVIVLYRRREGVIPHGLKGLHNDRLQLLSYDNETLGEMLELALDFAEETSDIRFNFFITPSISAYLDWVAREKKIPRSVFLRHLIERDMTINAQNYQPELR